MHFSHVVIQPRLTGISRFTYPTDVDRHDDCFSVDKPKMRIPDLVLISGGYFPGSSWVALRFYQPRLKIGPFISLQSVQVDHFWFSPLISLYSVHRVRQLGNHQVRTIPLHNQLGANSSFSLNTMQPYPVTNSVTSQGSIAVIYLSLIIISLSLSSPLTLSSLSPSPFGVGSGHNMQPPFTSASRSGFLPAL